MGRLKQELAEFQATMSALKQDHHAGTPWDVLGRFADLERRLADLERAAMSGLMGLGTTTLLAPGAILARTTQEAPDGHILFYGVGVFGRFMVWESDDPVNATAQTCVPDGDEDVTARIYGHGIVLENTGGVSAGNVFNVAVGANANIYNDGVDVCQIAVSAGGAVTVQRTAGADTFKVWLWFGWI